MALETELGNLVHQTDIVAATMTEAFVTRDNPFPLILTETFPDTTNVVRFAKSGSVDAAAGTESSPATFSELTDTDTTVTGTRKESAQKLTVEADRFGSPFNTVERVSRLAGEAMVRLASSELKTLFSSVTNETIATSTLTNTEILNARFNVRSNSLGAGTNMLVGYLDYKGMNELDIDLIAQGGTAFTTQVDLGMLGTVSAGEPRGALYDVVLYETTGLPTDTGDDVGCVWDPGIAFCAGIDGINGFQFNLKPPESQEPWFELYTYSFWAIALHNDTAACKVRSDS